MALTHLEETGNLSQEAGENCRGTGTPMLEENIFDMAMLEDDFLSASSF